MAGPLSMGPTEDSAPFDSLEGHDRSRSTINDDDNDEKGTRKIEKESTAKPPKRRDPDAVLPTSAIKKFIVKIASITRFFKSTEGIFSLRMGIVSVALWIPSVIHSTAWFYYDNKGFWALIMAQTGLALYAGDQIASFLARLAGTLLGLVFGMVVWYIGAGRGHGNPYGIVIITVVMLSPFIFMRVAGPQTQVAFWTMISVTIVFVVGYSWINANQFVISNPGIGVTLGWKRALLVIIGFTAAFIVMLFPNPISSRVLVRKTLAAVINEVGNIFAGEVEAFLAEEERARNGILEKVEFVGKAGTSDDDLKTSPKEKRTRRIGKRVVAVSTRLRDLYPSLTTAKFEPQISGTWPHKEYEQLFMIQNRMLGSLALLIASFTKLDTKWCSALVHRTPFMNPNFLSDVFTTIDILSNCLMHGHPLPAYLPKLRERLVYHEHHSALNRRSTLAPMLPRIAGLSLKATSGKERNFPMEDSTSHLTESQEDNISTREVGPVVVDGTTIGIELNELTLDVLLDEQLPAHSTAVVALSSLISRADEAIDIIRTLCGEATFRGYEYLQQDYLDREERAVGGGAGAFTDGHHRQRK